MLNLKTAFVVEIDEVAGELAERRLSGRVEHVLSGSSREFATGAELLGFMEQHIAFNPRRER